MPHTCDGCGERVTRLTLLAEGPWRAGGSAGTGATGKKKMTRLASLLAFRFRVSEVLLPGDAMTAPTVRLMIAVDDVRRAQIQLVEVDERPKRHRALGDFLYFLRLLFSHIHEAGNALRQLDGWAQGGAAGENRVNALLAGEEHRDGMKALRKLRQFFGRPAYGDSLIPRVRNTIGSTTTSALSPQWCKETSRPRRSLSRRPPQWVASPAWSTRSCARS